MADTGEAGGSENDDVSFLRTVRLRIFEVEISELVDVLRCRFRVDSDWCVVLSECQCVVYVKRECVRGVWR